MYFSRNGLQNVEKTIPEGVAGSAVVTVCKMSRRPSRKVWQAVPSVDAVIDSSRCTATKVEDGAVFDSSPDHCTNNNLLAPESSEQDTCRDACMNIRLRTER
ncbi:hypothetical protein OSTOST_03811, partial [Ostertagia ostertagi]